MIAIKLFAISIQMRLLRGNLGSFRFDVWHVSLFLGHKMRLGGASSQHSFLGQGPGVAFFMWWYGREKVRRKFLGWW